MSNKYIDIIKDTELKNPKYLHIKIGDRIFNGIEFDNDDDDFGDERDAYAPDTWIAVNCFPDDIKFMTHRWFKGYGFSVFSETHGDNYIFLAKYNRFESGMPHAKATITYIPAQNGYIEDNYDEVGNVKNKMKSIKPIRKSSS